MSRISVLSNVSYLRALKCLVSRSVPICLVPPSVSYLCAPNCFVSRHVLSNVTFLIHMFHCVCVGSHCLTSFAVVRGRINTECVLFSVFIFLSCDGGGGWQPSDVVVLVVSDNSLMVVVVVCGGGCYTLCTGAPFSRPNAEDGRHAVDIAWRYITTPADV